LIAFLILSPKDFPYLRAGNASSAKLIHSCAKVM